MPNSEPQRGADGFARYALPAIAIGLVLFGASFLPMFASGRERWTKEQALELQQASMRIQELTHKLASQTPDSASRSASDDYHQAVDHFKSLQLQLKDARSHRGGLGAVLRILGLLLAVGGAATWLASKRKPAELRPIRATRLP